MAAAASPPPAGSQMAATASDAALAAATAPSHPVHRFAAVSPHTLPPSILRLLSLASPIINGLHDLIQLATWTGPSGGGTRSTLLLLVWTAICLFAYPLLRYAPQLMILSVILVSAVPNVLLPPSPTRRGRGTGNIGSLPTFAVQTLTQAQTQLLLQKVSDILDVSSTLHAHLVLPVWQALTWNHPRGPGVTVGVAVLCLTVGSVWTICFADWPAAWVKVIHALPLERSYSLIGRGVVVTTTFAQGVYNTKLKSHVPPALDRALLKFIGYLYLVHAHKPSNLLPSSIQLAVFPPFPLFSLRLSHVTLSIGLIAFSWCSTYATLVRYALWKSATVRWAVRAVLRVASAGYLGDPPGSNFSRDTLSGGVALSSSPTVPSTLSGKSEGRTNTVHYRFDLYENQRWWMGLDWTAALLPQERASWTDTNLSPVSPPASFTLPAEHVIVRQTEGGKWEKRIVKWSWDEDEWRVVIGEGGRIVLGDGNSEATPTPSVAGSPRRSSSALPSSPSGASTLFSSFARRASSSSASSSDKTSEEPLPTSPPSPFQERSSTSFEEGEVEEETDSSGWRYGDNSWEKMGPKSGMGKYTRRRRWVRRALMEEHVQLVDAPPVFPSSPARTPPAVEAGSEKSQLAVGNAEKQVPDEGGESLAKNTSEKGLSTPPVTSGGEVPKLNINGSSTSNAPATPSPSMSGLGVGVGLGSPKVDFRTRLANAGKVGGTPPGEKEKDK